MDAGFLACKGRGQAVGRWPGRRGEDGQVAAELGWLAAAGALGALSRYGMGALAYRALGTALPWGTLLVNVVGCFLLGFIMHYGLANAALSRTVRLAVTVGFLGSFTTFSTFGYETLRYLESGAVSLALANIALNLLVGLAAVWAGLALARTVLGSL